MDFFWIVLIGCPTGVIARLLHAGQGGAALLASALLGAYGAFLGALFAALLGLYEATEALGLVACLVGAIVLLWLVQKGPNKPRLQTTANTCQRKV